jgi:hypothetical protein
VLLAATDQALRPPPLLTSRNQLNETLIVHDRETRLIPGESEEERLIAWVIERRKSVEPVTGVAVGEFLGRSARTGRNRLKALQELRPDLFEGAE